MGIEFGTIGLRKRDTIFEITTYRSEAYDRTSRKPDVKYGTSLVGDLERRDFTINAMAARLPSFELVDPFGGLAALRGKVIRTPGRPEDSFSDDPLRILRAARFAARLGFTVAPEVQAAMREGPAAVDRVGGADHRRADQADARPADARGAGSTCWCAPAWPSHPARAARAADGGRRAPPAQGRLHALADRAPPGDRPGAQVRARPDLVLRLAAILHDIGKPRTRSLLPGGRWPSTTTRWSGPRWPASG